MLYADKYGFEWDEITVRLFYEYWNEKDSKTFEEYLDTYFLPVKKN